MPCACLAACLTTAFQGPHWLRVREEVVPRKLEKMALVDVLEDELKNDQLAEIFSDAIRILADKNADYSSSADRIRNFRKTAEKTGVSMEKVWLVYFSKGMDAIERYCRDGELSSEKIRERILDAMNYMALLWLIANDPKEE